MSQQRFSAAQEAVLAKHGVASESLFVDVPPLRGPAHVLTAGSGPPLVMINGAGVPAAMFAPLLAHLQGFRSYVIDHPGHGLSGVWEGFADDLPANSTQLIQSILDEVGVRSAAFIGNSFGSRVVLWFAAARPEMVVASSHIGCPAIALESSAPLPMRVMATRLGPIIMRLSPPSERQLIQLAKMVKEHPLDPEMVELLVATELQDGFATTLHGIHRNLLRLRGARPGASLTPTQLAAVDHPVQIIWGSVDPFGSPDLGRRMAQAISSAEFHVVPGGHAPWLRSGAEIAHYTASFFDSVMSAD